VEEDMYDLTTKEIDRELELAYKEEASLIVSDQAISGYGKLEQIEKLLMEQYQQPDMHTTHHLFEGIYTREVYAPAGTIITGKRHKFNCTSILARGAMTLASVYEDGSTKGFKLLFGAQTFNDMAGYKKIAYTHEDCHFINIFKVPEHLSLDDMDALEDYLYYEIGEQTWQEL
jgi:hypothetical protein